MGFFLTIAYHKVKNETQKQLLCKTQVAEKGLKCVIFWQLEAELVRFSV